MDRLDLSRSNNLPFIKARLAEADCRLYAALAAAILDADKVAELDAFPRWRDIAPIALDLSWGG